MSVLREILRKIPDKFQLVGAAIALVVAPLTSSPYLAGSLLALFMFALSVHRRSAKMIAWMAARQLRSVLIISGLLAAIGLSFVGSRVATDGWREAFIEAHELKAQIALNLLIAFFLGVLVTLVIDNLNLSIFIGDYTSNWELLSIAVFSLGILIFPWKQGEPLEGAFLIGLATGVGVYRGVTLSVARQRAAHRRVEHLKDIWPSIRTNSGEQKAYDLLKKGRDFFGFGKFGKLRRLLENLRRLEDVRLKERPEDEPVWTKRLTLISGTAYRLEGEFDRAIEETEIEGVETLEDEVDPHLILLRITCLNELNKTQEADSLIDMLLQSDHGEHCPLTNLLHAERLAQQVLEEPEQIVSSQAPLAAALKAFALQVDLIRERIADPDDKTIDAHLSKFTEVNVPKLKSAMTNILGLSYLTAGNSDLAKAQFAKCIVSDPMMSSPYLHLGDYFLFGRRIRGGTLRNSDIRSARAAYYAADLVEGLRESRVHVMVQDRLDMIERIESRGVGELRTSPPASSGSRAQETLGGSPSSS